MTAPKHGAPHTGPVTDIEAQLRHELALAETQLRKYTSGSFVRKLGEEVAVAYAAGFGGVLFASGANLSTAAFSGALTAGLRAVYGLFVKNVGTPDSPTVK